MGTIAAINLIAAAASAIAWGIGALAMRQQEKNYNNQDGPFFLARSEGYKKYPEYERANTLRLVGCVLTFLFLLVAISCHVAATQEKTPASPTSRGGAFLLSTSKRLIPNAKPA